MKIVQQYVADDGTVFDDEIECAAHEEMLPFVALIAQVEDAAIRSAGFADKIEELGARIARNRRGRGELKRFRRAGDTLAPTTPRDPITDAPFENHENAN